MPRRGVRRGRGCDYGSSAHYERSLHPSASRHTEDLPRREEFTNILSYGITPQPYDEVGTSDHRLGQFTNKISIFRSLADLDGANTGTNVRRKRLNLSEFPNLIHPASFDVITDEAPRSQARDRPDQMDPPLHG